MLPRISLVTPSFQQSAYLPECLDSVRTQGYPELEHLVVDGGSTDGSVEVIREHAGHLAWWCSEPDTGQSAALNKGLAHATGTVFGWLNSDDLLLPNALLAVGQAFAKDPGLVICTAARIRRHADGHEEQLSPDPNDDPEALFTKPMVHQSSTFMRMDSVRGLGGVEEKLRYVMDLELWWQLLFRHGPGALRVLPQPLSVFRLHTASKTVTAQAGFVDETAGLLHGLCLRTGLQHLATVLELGHSWPTGLRPMPVTVAHAALVQRMVLRFLLHWNRVVFTRRQFRMMRALLACADSFENDLDPGLRQHWAKVQEQLAVPGWAAFRLRRKLRHWTGGRNSERAT